MQFEIIYLIIGMFGLWIGSGIVVEHGEKIAKSLNISSRVVGLTVASLGSSLGEMLTNVVAGLRRNQGIEASGIAFGTIIGSNISLITFVLGFCGLFTVYYLERKKKSMKRDWTMLLIAIILMFLFSLDGVISIFEGILLISAYGFYFLVVLKQEEVFDKVIDAHHNHKSFIPKTILSLSALFVGVLIAIYSANLIVDNGVEIANSFRIQTVLIGILVGFSTSLPELTISLRAILRGAHGLSIGNIVGGNIVDPLLSLGLGAFIAPIKVDKISLWFDVPFVFFATLLALIFFKRGGKLDKIEASALIGVYVLFLVLKFFII